MIKTMRLMIIGLFVLSLISCVSKSRYVDLEGDFVSTKEQIDLRNKQIQELEDQRKAQEQKIERMETEIEEKRRQLQELDGKLVEKEMSLHATERELLDHKKELQGKEEVIDMMASTRRSIEDSLKDQIAAKQVKLETLEGKLKITFVDKILFNSGSAWINQAGQDSLLSLADTLKQKQDQVVVVEGHTDDVPVGQALQQTYPTNWELSTARATSVVRFLQDKAGIEPELLSAVGYSFYRPVADNETEEGRAQNRRIEIILVPPR